MLESIVVVVSEMAMALYPILIKKVPTDLTTQIFSRLILYATLAGVFGGTHNVELVWGSVPAALKTTALGGLMTAHIASSYYAFQQLPAGISMALFYTYPIWNLVGASLFLCESFSFSHLLLVAIAFLGALLIIRSQRDASEQENKPVSWSGIAAAFGAAVTESLVYFSIRGMNHSSPFKSIFALYSGAILPFTLYLLARSQPLDFRWEIWKTLLPFHVFVGFLGIVLWAWAIPRVSTILFSLLSFFGVVASFGWGWLFVNETPSFDSLLGSGLITGASAISYWV